MLRLAGSSPAPSTMETSAERFEKLKVAVAMWNELPGDKLTLIECKRRFCYHKIPDREPKRWKGQYLCNKCGYLIENLEE